MSQSRYVRLPRMQSVPQSGAKGIMRLRPPTSGRLFIVEHELKDRSNALRRRKSKARSNVALVISARRASSVFGASHRCSGVAGLGRHANHLNSKCRAGAAAGHLHLPFGA